MGTISPNQTIWIARQAHDFYLEFGFKPLRIIEADVRDRNGVVARQKVHYLVYYVQNNGRHLNPAPAPDEFGNVTHRNVRIPIPPSTRMAGLVESMG